MISLGGAVGSVLAFTGILGAKMLAGGTSPVLVVATMLLGGAAIGLMIGVLVQYFDVQPFIASLAGLFLARGLAFVVSLQSVKVTSPGILWLQSTRIRFGDWYITPTGILALVGSPAPILRPVNFALHGRWLLVRTGEGRIFEAAQRAEPASFVVSEVDRFEHTGFSVVVSGTLAAFEREASEALAACAGSS